MTTPHGAFGPRVAPPPAPFTPATRVQERPRVVVSTAAAFMRVFELPHFLPFLQALQAALPQFDAPFRTNGLTSRRALVLEHVVIRTTSSGQEQGPEPGVFLGRIVANQRGCFLIVKSDGAPVQLEAALVAAEHRGIDDDPAIPVPDQS